MADSYYFYAILILPIIFVTCFLIGRRNLLDPGRLIGWHFGLLLLTYLLRPAATAFFGDTWVYRWLGISSFDKTWPKMTLAVGLAIISLAAGYWFTKQTRDRPRPRREWDERHLKAVILFLLAAGYFVLYLGPESSSTRPGSLGAGVHTESSYYLQAPSLMIGTALTLLYLIKGRFLLPILLATPWLVAKFTIGYGRIDVIGFFFGLFAAGILRRRWAGANSESRQFQNVLVGVCAIGVVLVLFPGAKASRSFFADRAFEESVAQAFQLNSNPEIWLGTNSDIQGFETTLYQLESQDRPSWGTHYIYYYLLKPIPRVLWPSKPVQWTLGRDWFGIQPDYRILTIGYTLGSIGTAYQQWGWLGIVFEFALTGWLFRRLERSAFASLNQYHIGLAYAGFFSLLPQVARDGLLYMIADRWLLVYGIPVLVLFLLKRNTQPTDLAYPKNDAELTPVVRSQSCVHGIAGRLDD